jgi:RimJ/RimL family protein N-acetyltransferase/ADP-ribose pyrophosphatase YjhB (NUDIX family)
MPESLPILGVNIAIFDGGRVLLTQREDFHVWCLPGGHVDANETAAQAALREAREETGLVVELTRLVGVYSTPRWGSGGAHILVFAARPVAGAWAPQAAEVLAMDWFDPLQPPEPLMWPHRQRLLDAAAAGTMGASSLGADPAMGQATSWLQDMAWPSGVADGHAALYAARDASGLTRLDYHQRHMGGPDDLGERCEVGAAARPLPEVRSLPWPLTVETERLVLREFTPTDYAAVYAYHQDPRYQRYYAPEEQAPARVRALVNLFLDGQSQRPRAKAQLAITLREGGALIGNVGLRLPRLGSHEADMGYELNPDHWGKGYATEAARAMLSLGFDGLGLHRISAWCLAENSASARLLERIGMTLEGRQRDKVWQQERWWDALEYAILADEWRPSLECGGLPPPPPAKERDL